MKLFYQLLLGAASVAAVHSTTIRGGSDNTMQLQEEGSDRHRHLEESTCTLYRKFVMHEPTRDHSEGYPEKSWSCKWSNNEDNVPEFLEIDESSPAVTAALANANSGESTLTMSKAVADTKELTLHIPENARMQVHSKTRNEKQVSSVTGTLTALVVRVSDMNNRAPDASVSKLRDDVFEDAVCLKSQTEACSYGKLKIQPFQGKTPSNFKVKNGVVDVKMDVSIASLNKNSVEMAATKAARGLLGDLDDPMFDLILFCLPPGSGGWLAKAYVSGKTSFYNNACSSVAIQMHEVGHNLGLAHSGETNQGEYGDRTGFMGASVGGDDHRMCYNPQKSYQLGWYKDKTKSINPLDGKNGKSNEYNFVLNGVSDYMGSNNKNGLIALRLEQTSREQDYYVGFNRDVGITEDISEDANMVTIARKEEGAPEKYGQSTKIASLNRGEKYVIENFNGEQRAVEIAFDSLTNGDAKITVTGSGSGDDDNDDNDDNDDDDVVVCENKAKKRFRLKKKSRKKKCAFFAKKNKCDLKTYMGDFVWERCEKACGRC